MYVDCILKRQGNNLVHLTRLSHNFRVDTDKGCLYYDKIQELELYSAVNLIKSTKYQDLSEPQPSVVVQSIYHNSRTRTFLILN